MLELLKDYNKSVLYHLGKDNLVADALSLMTMGSVSHMQQGKKELVKDVHRLARPVSCWKIFQMVVLWSIITAIHH